ncbi:MAG: PadR family transcriptional regulator [Candidatus Acidiferrales bacterium]
MPLPPLSSLQFSVLGALLDAPRTGRALRRTLRDVGVRRTLAAFYQLMARLEAAGWVEGWYEQEVIRGQLIKERHYRITAAGSAAWQATKKFYASEAGPSRARKGLAHA